MWTLDPIDGTKGFLRGEQYAVCLALLVDAKVQVGVMGCPNLPVDASNPGGPKGCLFIAVRGRGAEQVRIPALPFILRITANFTTNFPLADTLQFQPHTPSHPTVQPINAQPSRIRRQRPLCTRIQRARSAHPRDHPCANANG